MDTALPLFSLLSLLVGWALSISVLPEGEGKCLDQQESHRALRGTGMPALRLLWDQGLELGQSLERHGISFSDPHMQLKLVNKLR